MNKLKYHILPLLLIAQFANVSLKAAYVDGDTAANFTMANRLAGGDLSLYDYAGHIVVLDFFAYWCGPCQSSSPDLEQNIAQYYAAHSGNPDGIPVTVIGVNIESGNEPLTDQFIENAGMTLVGNDYQNAAYGGYSMGYIPHFVVINGVADSSSHGLWEIIHTNYGYRGASFYRNLIDAVVLEEFDLTGWTFNDNYPFVHSPEHGWLYYLPSEGGLWVYKYRTGQWKFKN